MRLKPHFIVFLLILVAFADSKRSRGRSRGSSSGSSTFWTRKSKSSSEPQKPAQPKPSAPKEPEIKKQSANVQQSAQQRPIGWDVDNKKPNLDAQKHHVNPSYSGNPGGYPNGEVYSNPGAGGVYSNNHGAAYPHNSGMHPNPGGYPQNTGMHPNPGGYPHNPGYNGYPQNPGYPGHGYNPQGGYYPNNMGGYGHNSGMGGYGMQTGMMGSFGGNKYGGYGYGMKKSGGFFGKHAFRNVLGGLFVWYLVSGLVSKPYKVYNYYNQPREERQEITLPANVLTLCNENATSICVPGSTAICTQDNKILCVSTMTSTTPCQNNSGELCVNSTIPCVDATDPLCQNKTSGDNTTTISLPCFTNMTLESGGASLAANVTLPASENNKFCVTSMAEPDPTLPPEEVNDKIEETATDNTGWDPTNLTGPDYYYSRYGRGY